MRSDFSYTAAILETCHIPWPVVKASSSVSGIFFCYDANNRIIVRCARESDCAVRRIITAAKKRLQNLLYKPIILNSGPHSAQTLQQQLLLLLLLLALRQNGTRDAHKISPHGTMTKRQL